MLVLFGYLLALVVAINITLVGGPKTAAAAIFVALVCYTIFLLLPKAVRRKPQ